MNTISEVIDIQQLAAQILQDGSLKERDRKAVQVVKGSGITVMLMALRAGAELKEHTAPGPITVHLIEGSINFIAEGKTIQLLKGQLVSLDAKVPHSVYAAKDSVFLLTMVTK